LQTAGVTEVSKKNAGLHDVHVEAVQVKQFEEHALQTAGITLLSKKNDAKHDEQAVGVHVKQLAPTDGSNVHDLQIAGVTVESK
jgi:hypothetical protein